jgi:hypothetical protein
MVAIGALFGFFQRREFFSFLSQVFGKFFMIAKLCKVFVSKILLIISIRKFVRIIRGLCAYDLAKRCHCNTIGSH